MVIHTICFSGKILVVSEELGLDMSEIKVISSDTHITPFDTGTLGSRITFLGGNATKNAAADAKKKLFEAVAGRIKVSTDSLVCKNHRIYVKDNPESGMSFNDAVWAYQEEHGGEEVVGNGTYAHHDVGEDFDGFTRGNYAKSYSFSTGAARVTVDEETGVVDISDFIFAHDCGRPLNPVAVEGQVEGSVQMRLGYALFEECIMKDGRMMNPSFRDYRFPTALDMPEIQTIFCGPPDPDGPFGAKECGEGSTAPVAPTITNAISNATGIRFDELPITPEKLWRALKEK